MNIAGRVKTKFTIILMSLALTAPAAMATEFPPSFAPLVERVKPAVVNIATTQTQPAMAQQQQQQQGMPQLPPGFEDFFRHFNQNPRRGPLHALGSGFIIDPSGVVVTNNHVVEHASDIKVTLQDGTTYKAKVLGTDDKSDLAVLKIEAGKSLPAVAFGDSDKARVGDWVVSVGNPFGLGGTVTAGILSASGRDEPASNAYVDFLQIDAPINQGNSGGPTFNEDGEVIGINSQILSPNGGGSVGIGFAIPSNIAKPIVAQIQKAGHVARGWLGVQMQPVTPDMEEALGLNSTNGVVVADVQSNTPAAKGGIKAGDVIVGYGDKEVKNRHDLALDVADTPPGQTVPVKVLRDGKPQTVPVKIEALKEQTENASAGDETGASGPLGLELSALNDTTRQQFGVGKDVSGAVVTGVKPDGSADHLGLRPGDVIVRVDSTQINAPSDVDAAVKKATDSGKKAVALLVNREGQNQFVAVPLSKDAG